MTQITLDDIYVLEEDKKLNTAAFEKWKKWLNTVEEKSSSKTAAMFYMQKTLNNYIDKKKGIDRSNTNEWYNRNVLYTAMEVGEVLEELKIKHWTRDTVIDKKKLLEEYVDVWHFIMSAAIDAGWVPDIINRVSKIMEQEWKKYTKSSRIDAGLTLIQMLECLSKHIKPMYFCAVSLFVESMAKAGITFDEFYKAYLVKNFKNFARQETFIFFLYFCIDYFRK